ncbi:hypothetical protein SOVF_193160 isoform A [Spinacia oleracea]|nr:hypothetical protein SOVF_193160 isoform A [Spinacia oleracea]
MIQPLYLVTRGDEIIHLVLYIGEDGLHILQLLIHRSFGELDDDEETKHHFIDLKLSKGRFRL